MSGLQEALYFPFLHFKTERIEQIRPAFSKICLLFVPSGDGNVGDTGKILPENLDHAFLKTLSRILEEKISLSGPESLRFLISEKRESHPSLSALVEGIKGSEEKKDTKESLEKEGVHLAALLLARAEELDAVRNVLGRELADIERTEKDILRKLTGEEEPCCEFAQKPVPEHLEPRMRAWLKLLGACREVPAFWITDMPDAERLLEKIFPEGEKKLLPSELGAAAGLGDGAAFFLEVPMNAAGLSGIAFSGGTQLLRILCLTEDRELVQK